MVRTVAERPDHFGEQPRPRGPNALPTAFDSRNRVPPDLLRIVAREEHAARRPAAGRVVELREPQAIFCQPVEDRRLNFTAIAAEVGVPQIIGQNDQDVGTRRGAGGTQLRYRNQQQRGKTGP
jgi:hypothetical protein